MQLTSGDASVALDRLAAIRQRVENQHSVAVAAVASLRARLGDDDPHVERIDQILANWHSQLVLAADAFSEGIRQVSQR